MKKIINLLILILLIPSFVKGLETETYDKYDYVIDNYDIQVIVNEDNTYDVVETIDINFQYYKEEIIRRIPLYNKFPRLDGLDIKDKVQITDIDVNAPYSKTIVNKDLVIKVKNGKKNNTERYIFKYKYNRGPDRLKGKDEFIFNIIGSDWDTVIKNISFTITMPKEFDSNKIVLLQGTKIELEDKNIDYIVQGNVIKGLVKKVNLPNQFVYARIELPENYFKGAKYKFDYKVIWMIIIPSICLVISFMLWKKYGKDEKIDIKEINKIDKYNSLEVEYLYYGNGSVRGICSLLVDLARRGFLTITRIKKEVSLNNKEDFKITVNSKKDLTLNEKIFIKGLLECKKDKVLEQLKDNEVLLSDLYNNFYLTLFKIQDNINNRMNHSWLFEKRFKEMIIDALMMIIAMFTIVSIPVISFSSFVTIFIILGLIIVYLPFFGYLISSRRIDVIVRILLLVILSIHLFIMFSLTPLYDAIMYDLGYFICFIYGLITVIIMFICLLYMSKRTKNGGDLLSEISSFKKSLMSLSKEDFNKLVKEDKKYYYDIISYVEILNIYEYIEDKLDKELLEYPEWFVNSDEIDKKDWVTYLHTFFDNSYEVMSTVVRDSK